MLVATLYEQRVEAETAPRSTEYACPGCGSPVFLKHGKKVVPHFAHKPNAACAFGVGEGRDHMLIKTKLAKVYRAKGYNVAIEFPLTARGAGNRKMIADLYVFDGKKSYAIEVVDTHDDMAHVNDKNQFYAAMDVECFWVPIVRKSKRDSLLKWSGRGKLRYRPTSFERWLLDWRTHVQFVIPPNRFVTCQANAHVLFTAKSSGGVRSDVSSAFRELTRLHHGTLNKILDKAPPASVEERKLDFQSIVNGSTRL